MVVREITQFSADYSYLDSASIEFLQSRFRGASAVVNVQGATKTVPIEALQPLNRLEAIVDLPPAPAQDSGAPARVASDGKARQTRMAEARQFLEKIEIASGTRENAAHLVEDMFHQGRAGKYTTKPALEAVEEILVQDVTRALTAIVGLKGSDQTYAHCVDMSVIFHEACTDILRQ